MDQPPGKRRRVSKLSLKYRPPPPPPQQLATLKNDEIFIVKRKKELSTTSTQIHFSPSSSQLSSSSPLSFLSPTQVHVGDDDVNSLPVSNANDIATTTTTPTKKKITDTSNNNNNNNNMNHNNNDSKKIEHVNKTPLNQRAAGCRKKQLGDGPMDGLFWRCEYCGHLVPQAYSTFNSTILEKRIKHYKKCAEGMKPKYYLSTARAQKGEDLAAELLLSNENTSTTSSPTSSNVNNINNHDSSSDNNNNSRPRNVFDILMASTNGSPIQSSSNLSSHNSGVKHFVKKNAFALMMNQSKTMHDNREKRKTAKNSSSKFGAKKKKSSWGRRFASTSRDPNMIPHYKVIKVGNNVQPIVVDGFQYADRARLSSIYFLSHFHSDHYIGLKKSFDGIIYCTQVTANLLLRQFKIKPEHVRALPLDKPVKLDMAPNIITKNNNPIVSNNTTTTSSSSKRKLQVVVTLIDANHCPGSCIMLFQIGYKVPYRYLLHTGDFRYIRSMRSHKALKDISHLECLYLDTTYCNPK